MHEDRVAERLEMEQILTGVGNHPGGFALMRSPWETSLQGPIRS
jgi:hypothetical protein